MKLLFLSIKLDKYLFNVGYLHRLTTEKQITMKNVFTNLLGAVLTLAISFTTANAQDQVCNDYRFYYSDTEGNSSDIYEVTLSEGVANMTLLKEVAYNAHIAYNSANNLLYLVNSTTGAYQQLDVSAADGAISTPVSLDISVSGVINATFNHDNKFMIAAESTDKIYRVTDELAGTTEEFSDAPIQGGDIAFDGEGNFLLATREGNGKLFRINTFNPVTLEYPVNLQIGTVPALVTGIARTNDGNIILSERDANAFVIYAADGSGPIEGQSYATPFTLHNGDMAAGCSEFEPVIEGCQNFKYYYIADNTPGYAQGTVFGGAIVNGEFELTQLFESGISAHLAVNSITNELYVINGSELRTYNEAGDLLNSVSTSGKGGLYAAVWNAEDGLVYAGSSNQNKIYKINPINGASELVASQVPVNGGDLIIDEEGNLLLLERRDNANSRLHLIENGSATLISSDLASSLHGAALMSNGGFIAAEGNGSNNIHMYDIEGTYGVAIDAVLDGELFTIYDGDMASGCFDDEEVIVVPEPGNCYATEVLEYIEGTNSNGGAIALSRTDSSKATGAPQRVDQDVFVTLGYGGSITLGFDGAVPNLEGDDIEIVETSFGNPSCDAYPEYAKIYVSQDGIDFVYASTVCRTNGFVDISDAPGNLEYIIAVKIVNDDLLSGSPDGFDVDGVVALHNCDFIDNDAPGLTSNLSSYPNPSTGQSTVTFTAAQTSKTLVEVMDMNGRTVATIFNSDAQAGKEYRVDFNGLSLPNGIYVTRMINGDEMTINKIMISK